MTYYDIIVIGAGIGGLTAAALLGRAGYRVLALEGHIEPGGCASSFERKRPGGERYVFDVGATLFAGFTPGGAHHWVGQRLGIRWPVRRLEPALETWLPDRRVTRWGDARWADERQIAFPAQAWEAERFWHEQERIADIAWRYAARQPPVPPETPVDLLGMSVRARPEMALLVPQLWRTVGQALSSHGIADRRLRAFVDGQLLISAQATARECAWLYGAVALDFARIGAHYVEGGAWSLARTLAAAFTRDAGAPRGWGACTLYLGVDEAAILAGMAEHHQVIASYDRPLGEANSVFISAHPADDRSRAPNDQRAITVSTHTDAARWWRWREQDPARYRAEKAAMAERMLDTVALALPEIRRHIRYQQVGTPFSFWRYTHRQQGMVGGLPQLRGSSGLWSLGPRAAGIGGLWLVGDSTFPGQSTAAVTQSGIRVYQAIRRI